MPDEAAEQETELQLLLLAQVFNAFKTPEIEAGRFGVLTQLQRPPRDVGDHGMVTGAARRRRVLPDLVGEVDNSDDDAEAADEVTDVAERLDHDSARTSAASLSRKSR